MKKRGFGAGRFNGFGGKVESQESIEEAVTREVFEECGLKTQEIIKMGIIYFELINNPELQEVHIYKCEKFLGTPIETDEMRPEWFEFKNIPFEKMWPDDVYWFNLFLNDKKFKGKFKFDENNKIIEYELKEIKKL